MASPEMQATEPTRRARRRAEVSQRVLDAAEALFCARGYDETTVAEICDAADVAYGTFFNHFPAKSDLLRAMGDRAVAEISAGLQALESESLGIEEVLELFFERFAERLETVSAGERALAARVQALAFTDPSEHRDQGFHAAFEAFLRRAIESGGVRKDLPAETLADLVSSTFASMSLSWVHVDGFPVRARAIALARVLGETLCPRATGTG